MTIINSLENLLSDIVRPIGEGVLNVVSHPIDTACNMLTYTADLAQEHPYGCAAVVGLGAYAIHKGWIKLDKNKLHINIDINAGPLGGLRTNTTLRLGPR